MLYIKDMFFGCKFVLTNIFYTRTFGVRHCVLLEERKGVRTTWFIKWAALGLYFMVLTLRHLQKLRSRFQHFPTLPPLCDPALISDKTYGHIHWLASHTLHMTFS